LPFILFYLVFNFSVLGFQCANSLSFFYLLSAVKYSMLVLISQLAQQDDSSGNL